MKLFTLDYREYFAISKITKISKIGPFEYNSGCSLKILFDNGEAYEKSYRLQDARDYDFDELYKAIEENNELRSIK